MLACVRACKLKMEKKRKILVFTKGKNEKTLSYCWTCMHVENNLDANSNWKILVMKKQHQLCKHCLRRIETKYIRKIQLMLKRELLDSWKVYRGKDESSKQGSAKIGIKWRTIVCCKSLSFTLRLLVSNYQCQLFEGVLSLFHNWAADVWTALVS